MASPFLEQSLVSNDYENGAWLPVSGSLRNFLAHTQVDYFTIWTNLWPQFTYRKFKFSKAPRVCISCFVPFLLFVELILNFLDAFEFIFFYWLMYRYRYLFPWIPSQLLKSEMGSLMTFEKWYVLSRMAWKASRAGLFKSGEIFSRSFWKLKCNSKAN